MSLTDDERRRLSALEQSLEREDPGLARRVVRLNGRFPGDRLWIRHRWTLLGICAIASVSLLVITMLGAMPVVRTFAILLNMYVALIAALLWFAQRSTGG
ncbi:MAG TPA: DUF3040 domain-containing protein [Streptosporangiaceae bacterium]